MKFVLASWGTRGDVEPSAHGRDTTEVHGRDLTLDEFIDAVTLTAARPSAGPADRGDRFPPTVIWPWNGRAD